MVSIMASYFDSGNILPRINHTYITLIPKVKSPWRVYVFRPIAMCNILYKHVSKVLANRLKRIMFHIIFLTLKVFFNQIRQFQIILLLPLKLYIT